MIPSISTAINASGIVHKHSTIVWRVTSATEKLHPLQRPGPHDDAWLLTPNQHGFPPSPRSTLRYIPSLPCRPSDLRSLCANSAAVPASSPRMLQKASTLTVDCL